jgi:hypothetical protein
MIDRTRLLSDLQRLLRLLEADLLERSESTDVPEVGRALHADFEQARQAERTSQSYEEWRSDYITQTAAAWVLSGVFVRFLEDNRLIDPPKLAGPGERLQRARDECELYFHSHPMLTDRDYLLSVFNGVASLPGGKEIFGRHNPLYEMPTWFSGDAAGELLSFFQRIDADTGKLVHDFTDPAWDTRFLGDLYQDLSEAARKKYALLQTPVFVEEFILDRTLEPALDEFGLEDGLPKPSSLPRDGLGRPSSFKMIDPACGSGHFLLGAFPRLLERWQKQEPGAKVRELVQRALDAIHGVDVNPFAVAIARFRLLLMAMRSSDITRLADAPAFHMNVVCGDSLLHGVGEQQSFGWRDVDHASYAEDLAELRRVLVPGRYHAVVANPPYITPKDRALNQAYRDRYGTCHRQYSLAVPFMERIFRLAVEGGFTGQITANSFMKREFGKKLIEQFLPSIDLTHVIDTSGAYIPGHGTPTVILFGRHCKPVAPTIRMVMGIRGEPSTPKDAARGLVWSAITDQVDQPGSQSEFVSVADSSRELFTKHPWSIGGGGASELKTTLEQAADVNLLERIDGIGFMVITGEDNCLLLPASFARRARLECVRSLGDGEAIRDWRLDTDLVVLWPCDVGGNRLALSHLHRHLEWLWPYRTSLKERKAFGVPVELKGIPWWALREVYPEKLRTPLSIVFAFVATHNHFVLDRGGKVFKQSAPVIKLPDRASEEDHLGLVGLLNSSVACFWMKQVFHDKGSTVDSAGARQTTVAFENFREFTGTGLQRFPLPCDRPLAHARLLDGLAQTRQRVLPATVLKYGVPTRKVWEEARRHYQIASEEMIAAQDELDWSCYRLYGLIDEDLVYSAGSPPSLTLGLRAFEIVMARKMGAGQLQTTWFERHSSTPITELPAQWPDSYRELVKRRIEAIETNPQIALIEQPEYKRRWNAVPWDEQAEQALREWLLDRLESYFDFDGRMNASGKATAKLDVALCSTARLADLAQQDRDFMQIGELYRGDPAFDVPSLVAELVEAESVPLLPVLRYKATGLRKRVEWETTWRLQRQEDAIDARVKLADGDPQRLTEDEANDLKRREIGDIPVPPKYTSADFLKSDYWRLRGKLDVPKERWVSFPHCEGPDGTLAIAWAGYDHLQLARAISGYYVEVQERLGGRDDPRLVPLLACLIELLPWLKQWHNEVDPEFRLPMGDYFEGFVQEEARQMGKTLDEIKAWQPPAQRSRRKVRR